jgi:hypothetical protein
MGVMKYFYVLKNTSLLEKELIFPILLFINLLLIIFLYVLFRVELHPGSINNAFMLRYKNMIIEKYIFLYLSMH